LYVNLSTAGSIVSNDACNIRNPVEDIHPPIPVLWSPENSPASTGTLESSLNGASSIAPQILLLAGLDNSAHNMPASQSETSSWGLNQFVSHHERIDDICLGSNDRAAKKVHMHNLLAQLDGILSILHPTTPSLS
jgi:hypothetical protein